jgi:hypothetical protein
MFRVRVGLGSELGLGFGTSDSESLTGLCEILFQLTSSLRTSCLSEFMKFTKYLKS